MHELSPETLQRDGYLVVRSLVDWVSVGFRIADMNRSRS